MTSGFLVTMTRASIVLVLLGCCAPSVNQPTDSSAQSFQYEYAAARSALERGEYAQAQRSYTLMAERFGNGPIARRLNLELSHAHLRAGAHADAKAIAEALLTTTSGAERAAAYAVIGVAAHEMSLQAEDKDIARRLRDESARALRLALSAAPELDRYGGLRSRLSEITDARDFG